MSWPIRSRGKAPAYSRGPTIAQLWLVQARRPCRGVITRHRGMGHHHQGAPRGKPPGNITGDWEPGQGRSLVLMDARCGFARAESCSMPLESLVGALCSLQIHAWSRARVPLLQTMVRNPNSSSPGSRIRVAPLRSKLRARELGVEFASAMNHRSWWVTPSPRCSPRWWWRACRWSWFVRTRLDWCSPIRVFESRPSR